MVFRLWPTLKLPTKPLGLIALNSRKILQIISTMRFSAKRKNTPAPFSNSSSSADGQHISSCMHTELNMQKNLKIWHSHQKWTKRANEPRATTKLSNKFDYLYENVGFFVENIPWEIAEIDREIINLSCIGIFSRSNYIKAKKEKKTQDKTNETTNTVWQQQAKQLRTYTFIRHKRHL